MQNLKLKLKNRLVNVKRLAVLGIGSDLRADDAAGMLIAEKVSKSQVTSHKFKVFLGETAPENFTGVIKKFKPTHLVIIDSADMGKKAGDVLLIEPKNVVGISFSTHSLPLNIMADYISKDINCEVVIIGIQPKTIEFGKPVSKEVVKAVKYTADVIRDIIVKI